MKLLFILLIVVLVWTPYDIDGKGIFDLFRAKGKELAFKTQANIEGMSALNSTQLAKLVEDAHKKRQKEMSNQTLTTNNATTQPPT